MDTHSHNSQTIELLNSEGGQALVEIIYVTIFFFVISLLLIKMVDPHIEKQIKKYQFQTWELKNEF